MATIVIRPKRKTKKTDIDAPAQSSEQEQEQEQKLPEPSSLFKIRDDDYTRSAIYCDESLFNRQQIKRTLTIPFHRISNLRNNDNIKNLLTSELSSKYEGKCSIEGYICPNSISIYNYSCGTLSGGNIRFDVVADCLVCFPDEHIEIKCAAKTITQAGIRGIATKLQVGSVSPIEVFLSRDMNIKNNELFCRVEEGDILTVEIIGRRFVLNDTHVTIIAMLLHAESPE
jgi:hypothetical protein